MRKIVLIGAGSGFGARFGTDIMANPVLRESEICLCDLHEERLDSVYTYLKKMVDEYRLPTKITKSVNRRDLLADADFVLTSIAAGGGAYYGEPFRSEIGIPRKYGIEQSVGDSYSVGSVFRFLRTAPVQLAICHDMEELCPNAWLLNQTNPMSALTAVHSLGSRIKNVGLCHGVVGTAERLAGVLGKELDDLSYKVAGMNHLAWFLELKDKATGEDLYPALRGKLTRKDDETAAKFLEEETVRVEILNQFGYFPTESNRHDSEYMPYFRRTPELIDEYRLILRQVADKQAERLWAKDGAGEQKLGELIQSREYNIPIMEAMTTDVPFRFNGNVMNTGLITSLPEKLCVEVPCIADRHGISPTYIGELPAQLAGIDRWLATPVQLMVEAVLERDRKKAYWAVAQDINVAAKLSFRQIEAMFDELWAAEGDLMRWFEDGTVIERCAEN